MNWVSIKERKPEKEGPYVVSISRPYGNGEYVFTYVAYYALNRDTWFKYDPFSDSSIGNSIENKVIGWVEDTTTYLG